MTIAGNFKVRIVILRKSHYMGL
uniref:Uncharacterized protein n=1 Tax=Rhizophora mucronata TaxID=61149 RepID=A0A2P2LE92_RHIMU